MPDIAQARRQLGFAVRTAAILTGTASAYCFDIHTPRASRTERLSAPEHHKYVRVLDWKVHYEGSKTNHEDPRSAGKL